MSNSKLICKSFDYTNYNDRGDTKIKKITPHHMAGNLSLEECAEVFRSRGSSANYIIDSNGNIGLFVPENKRAWTSSSRENDYQAVTIEVANCGGEPDWKISDKAFNACIDLCVDICKRNDIKSLNFTGDKNGNLTAHKMFAATACPGPYFYSKFPELAKKVNEKLKADTSNKKTMYRVQIGGFNNYENAVKLAEQAKKAGFEVLIKAETNEVI